MKTISKNQIFVVSIVSICFLIFSCNATRTQKGGAIGAGTGAAIGGVIGNQSDNTVVGAIIGAAVGGAAGAVIGRQMDKQAEELQKDLEGATVERVGEGIKITFESGFMFAHDSDEITSDTRGNLAKLATTLKKYDDTNILIEGHTDATGTDEYNKKLSEERADAVKDFLKAEGVASKRIADIGYGESQPIADNQTTDGRQKNRRVEVAIFANNKMKKAAERGDI
jgi:outer membrane protein OmpA-like peptidoglycan-associated protein